MEKKYWVLCILDNDDAECALRVQLSAACPDHVTLYPVRAKRFMHAIWIITKIFVEKRIVRPHLIICHQDDPGPIAPSSRTLCAEDLQRYLLMCGIKIPTIVLQTREMTVGTSDDFIGGSLLNASAFLDAVQRNIDAVYPTPSTCPECKKRDPKAKFAFNCPKCGAFYRGRPQTVLEMSVT